MKGKKIGILIGVSAVVVACLLYTSYRKVRLDHLLSKEEEVE